MAVTQKQFEESKKKRYSAELIEYEKMLDECLLKQNYMRYDPQIHIAKYIDCDYHEALKKLYEKDWDLSFKLVDGYDHVVFEPKE